MTKMNLLAEKLNSSSDKKYDSLLRSRTTDSKDMKTVLSPSNILTPPRTINEEVDPMKNITNDHLDALNAHKKEVERKVKEDKSE